MSSTQCIAPISRYASQDPSAYDEALLLEVTAGSESAFAELQRNYSRRLYKRILSITRNHEDAEDALQDTFLRAYRALSSFQGKARFSTWLTRIAINSALMIVRRRRARPEISLQQPSSLEDDVAYLDFPDATLNPEEICDQQQRAGAILGAIDSLKPKLRDPIHIWMSHEHSMKEVALRLGISLGSAKARLHRARKHILRSQSSRNRRNAVGANHQSALIGKGAGFHSSIPKYHPHSESQSPSSES